MRKNRDHFVPRLLIRQFTNHQGRVFCLDKQKRSIPERDHGNLPRDILFRRGYYFDNLGNLDDELYKPIENAFAPHLLNLVANVQQALATADCGDALLDWMAAQLSRTQEVEAFFRSYAERYDRSEMTDGLRHKDGQLNSWRLECFHRNRESMKACEWRVYTADENEPRRFVLGDEPVIRTLRCWATGTMYLMPLSSRQLVAGGTAHGHRALTDPRRNILPGGINGLALSCSRRFVYAARLLELNGLLSMFDIKGDPEHDAWMREASQPYFGMQEFMQTYREEELDAFKRRRKHS